MVPAWVWTRTLSPAASLARSSGGANRGAVATLPDIRARHRNPRTTAFGSRGTVKDLAAPAGCQLNSKLAGPARPCRAQCKDGQ